MVDYLWDYTNFEWELSLLRNSPSDFQTLHADWLYQKSGHYASLISSNIKYSMYNMTNKYFISRSYLSLLCLLLPCRAGIVLKNRIKNLIFLFYLSFCDIWDFRFELLAKRFFCPFILLIVFDRFPPFLNILGVIPNEHVQNTIKL